MNRKVINKELDALVSLLDEPDNNMFGQVRKKIFSYGTDAIPALEDAWGAYLDNTIQQRIEVIIHHIQFNHIYNELQEWKTSNGQDLLKGFVLIAKYQYPNMNEKSIIDEIGKIIHDVWLELNNNLTPLEKIKVINHIIFDVHGFKGDAKDMHVPQNSFINKIIETKKANPISLGIIYMIVTQSLKIPVYGINLPRNFILAYMGGMINDDKKNTESDVQFYLNPFNKGAVFTRREVEQFLSQINVEHDKKYFLPCDNITIIKRVLNNLIFSYEKSGEVGKVDEIKKLQPALD